MFWSWIWKYIKTCFPSTEIWNFLFSTVSINHLVISEVEIHVRVLLVWWKVFYFTSTTNPAAAIIKFRYNQYTSSGPKLIIIQFVCFKTVVSLFIKLHNFHEDLNSNCSTKVLTRATWIWIESFNLCEILAIQRETQKVRFFFRGPTKPKNSCLRLQLVSVI